MGLPISEAIQTAINAMLAGVCDDMLRYALIADGVSPKNAEIILRWGRIARLRREQIYATLKKTI